MSPVLRMVLGRSHYQHRRLTTEGSYTPDKTRAPTSRASNWVGTSRPLLSNEQPGCGTNGQGYQSKLVGGYGEGPASPRTAEFTPQCSPDPRRPQHEAMKVARLPIVPAGGLTRSPNLAAPMWVLRPSRSMTVLPVMLAPSAPPRA